MHIRALGPDARYTTRLLSPSDLVRLQHLFEDAADYFLVMTGSAPAPDEAQRAFVAGPPTKSVNDKRTIGIFNERALVGVLDAMTDWPEDGTWTMGMLLLHPRHRGLGLGAAVLAAYEVWATSEGAQVLRTAVALQHIEGSRFLLRHGYRAARAAPAPDTAGSLTAVTTFTKGLLRGEKGLS
ncbi:MAG TPA: GNAT family N-acetyltransferase [Gemmatimonadales bacterium]